MNKMNKAILGTALIGLAYLASKKVLAFPSSLGALSAGQLSLQETSEIVRWTLASDNFPNVTPLMLGTVIEIESSRKPFAIRPEPRIEDFSVGMTQTLTRTARVLHDNLGFNMHPRPAPLNLDYPATDTRRVSESPAKILFDPRASIYYGAAALQDIYWYSTSQEKTDEWVIRAYNGGPRYGPTSSDTVNHWAKYQIAEEQVRPYYTGGVSIG